MLTLAEIIRQKIDDGRLPEHSSMKTWAGYGRGNPCSACEQPIAPAQTEYEVDAGDHTYWLHIGCYGLWEAERRRRGLTKREESA
jgi:hypothetical protein